MEQTIVHIELTGELEELIELTTINKIRIIDLLTDIFGPDIFGPDKLCPDLAKKSLNIHD